jgi:aryl-alcohol dehydrogenase-like predicted oxidoreductase
MQNLYNLLDRDEEREMIPQCIDMGVGLIPYSPLARGFLVGTRSRDGAQKTVRAGSDPVQEEVYGSAADFDVAERLAAVAAERGVPAAQLAIAWMLQRPGVTAPIVGATKLSHVEDALAATALSLSDDEVARLEGRVP